MKPVKLELQSSMSILGRNLLDIERSFSLFYSTNSSKKKWWSIGTISFLKTMMLARRRFCFKMGCGSLISWRLSLPMLTTTLTTSAIISILLLLYFTIFATFAIFETSLLYWDLPSKQPSFKRDAGLLIFFSN
jgi:hypothetical protein